MLILSACNKKTADSVLKSPCYDITLSIDSEAGTIDASQEILYTAPENSECFVLHIYANAFNADNNVIDILSAQIDRQTAEYDIYGKDKTLLKLHGNFTENTEYLISLTYKITIPHADARLGITKDGNFNLSCFYPVMAKYDNGYREDCYSDFGDPFFQDISSYFVLATVDSALRLASSGKVITTSLSEEGAKTTYEIEAENIRDFGMALGKFNLLNDVTESGVTVNYFYLTDNRPSDTLERAMSAVTSFSEAFGTYPYDTLTIAECPLDMAGGMEYGTFVTVSNTKNYIDFLDAVTHEIAHQWWYGVVGNDQINSAWLDEGAAEFCTYYYYYLIGDRLEFQRAMTSLNRSYQAFEASKGFVQKSLNRPLDSYVSSDEYVAANYLKGAIVFDTLHTLIGDEKFKAAMQNYFNDNKFSVADADKLQKAFLTQGYDITAILHSFDS